MAHDRVENIHRDREDDGAVVLSRYVVQGLQISQLKRAFYKETFPLIEFVDLERPLVFADNVGRVPE